ncbi:MAG: hypothetical protein HUJ76_03145 [Parasporobacterium sp.]|nr:hypothetical protein [Parasporobacterium sp.]
MHTRITAGSYFLHTGENETGGYVIIRLLLKESVKPDVLKDAVQASFTRFPYFSVKLVLEGTDFYLVDNDLPPVVTEDGEPFELGAEISNFHLLGFSCKGNYLYVFMDHMLTDGRGISDFIYTLLYCYFKNAYNRDFDCPGCRKPGEEIGDNEYEDPFGAVLPVTGETGNRGNEHFFRLPEAMNDSGDCRSHIISISQKDLMQAARNTDNSPSTFVVLKLMEAIDEVHPDHKEKININLCADVRGAIHMKDTHQCSVVGLNLVYDDKLRSMPEPMRGTCIRGQVIIQNDEESLKDTFRFMTDAEHGLMEIRDLEQRIKEYKKGLDSTTPIVSYVGKYDFGELNRFVESVIILTDAAGSMLIEINAIEDRFFLSMSSRVTSDVYADAFMHQLELAGVPYTLEEVLCYRMPEKHHIKYASAAEKK